MQQYFDKYFEEINYKGATGVSADSAEKNNNCKKLWAII